MVADLVFCETTYIDVSQAHGNREALKLSESVLTNLELEPLECCCKFVAEGEKIGCSGQTRHVQSSTTQWITPLNGSESTARGSNVAMA